MGSPVSHSSSSRQTSLLDSPESMVFGGEEALLGLGYKPEMGGTSSPLLHQFAGGRWVHRWSYGAPEGSLK